MEPEGLNKEQWLEKLTLIDQSLQRQGGSAQLTLVGSAAGILTGQPGSTVPSIDLDVWKPWLALSISNSQESGGIGRPSLRSQDRGGLIGLTFNWSSEGLTQLGKFESTECLEQFHALRLERPPMANLVAAKLVRAAPKDLADIAYLLSVHRPARQDIEQAIASMPREARGKAAENLVYLDAMSGNQ